MVLAIAGLILAFAGPALFAGRAGMDHKTAVKSIAAGLKSARNEALSTARETTFSVDVESRTYRVGNGRLVALPKDLRLVLRTAEAETQSDQLGNIRFYADGSSTGGFVAVSSSDQDRSAITISVDWLTGHVSVSP